MPTLRKYNGKGGNVVIPGRATKIGAEAFTNRADVNNVTVPDSVTEIEAGAFDGCPNIRVTYKGHVYTAANIGGLYINMSDFDIVDNDFEIKNGVLMVYNGTGGDVVIPNGVTKIGDKAFYDCSSLTSITIPDSVTVIGIEAFCDCESLASITIPDSVTVIGHGAFSCCGSLTSITIPNSVAEIGRSVFSFCDSITSITIPNSVTVIERDAFDNYSNINIS